jgi:hypothetical protein
MRKKATKRNPMPTKARAVKKNPARKYYYSLLSRSNLEDGWVIEFGDYDKKAVMYEMVELKRNNKDLGLPFVETKIIKTFANQKALLDAVEELNQESGAQRKRNPTATRAPARPRTKLISNGRKTNPSPKDVFFVNVIDDGGFIYGMDDRTPVTFRFSNRELTRGIYRSFALPYAVTSNPAFQAYAKSLPQGLTVMSLAQLKNKLRDFA